MRRFGFGLLLLVTVLARPGVSQSPPSGVDTPTVTAKGTAGDEDVGDLTLHKVALKAGETLLVSCNDEGGDVEMTWNGTPLHKDAGTKGSGFYTTLFSLYSAAGGSGDIVITHVSGGDLSVNAYAVTGLAPAALDRTAAAQGMGATPSSGATATTTHASEFLWGAIGYATNSKASGTWNDGFTAGGEFTDTGGIGGVEDGYKTVSSTGAYTAAKTGVDKSAWAAVIATYATAAGRDPGPTRPRP
jgi:hypothetical protein